MDQRLSLLRDILPLAVLESSHLAGSVIGLALLILAARCSGDCQRPTS